MECSICLNLMTEKGEVTPCGHIFHHVCIKGWLDRGNRTCPSCRKPTSNFQLKPVFLPSNYPVPSSSYLDDLIARKDKKIKDQQELISKLEGEKRILRKGLALSLQQKHKAVHELTGKVEDLKEKLRSLRKHKNGLLAMNSRERDMVRALSARIGTLEAELCRLQGPEED